MRIKAIPKLLLRDMHMIFDRIAQVCGVEMSVNFGRQDVFVPQKFLHLANVGTTLQQMCRK